MAAKLEVHFQGESTASGKLSVVSFGNALLKLGSAVRFTASQLYTAAEGPAESRGRLANVARRIDLQLEAVAPASSVDLTFSCVSLAAPGDHLRLWDDLPERTIERLLADISAEAAGKRTNVAVRKFLGSLPPGTRQRYTGATPRGAVTVDVGANVLGATSGSSRGVVILTGTVAEIGFEPAKEFVVVRTAQKSRRLRASADLIARALELRDEPVRVVVRRGKENWLLRIDAASAEIQGTEASRWAHTSARWGRVLERLAR